MKENKKNPPKVEFYLSLLEIRQMYDEGYVFAKTIYEKLVKDKKISMSYMQFSVYFKKEIKEKTSVSLSKKEIITSETMEHAVKNRQSIAKIGDDDWEPISFTVGSSTSKRFNPHAHGIDPKNIL